MSHSTRYALPAMLEEIENDKDVSRFSGSVLVAHEPHPDEANAFADALSEEDIKHETRDVIASFFRRLLEQDGDHDDAPTYEEFCDVAGEHALNDLLQEVLLLGARENASDIHFQPTPDGLRVRFRIDGILHDRLRLDRSFLTVTVSALKVMAKADIAEKRIPHDGRISLPVKEGAVTYRLSSVPGIDGERIALRVLGRIDRRAVPDLTQLGFSSSLLASLHEVLQAPNGLFFVTGPAGCGKTTTLFSMLRLLNRAERNLLTVEDPVEYRLPGASQVQIDRDAGFDFAQALPAFLRQDPDVILVGEVRDPETAHIATEAALTGHLIFSTMHTNSALHAIARLVQIGVAPYLVAPSLLAVMAQRLVRRICNHCKQTSELSAEEAAALFEKADGAVKTRWGEGCESCRQTGYAGRTALGEIFLLNEDMRQKIVNRASLVEIRRCAARHDFRPLRYDGLKKVLGGVTTFDEINRVLGHHDETVALAEADGEA